MPLELVTEAGDGMEPSIRLVDDGRLLGRRLISDFSTEDWREVRRLLHEHNCAVALERAEKMRGVIPLPPDRVPAAEHFMAAVRILFPGYVAPT